MNRQNSAAYTANCDHRYAAGGYRPGDLLRHLVQVRDGECAFPGWDVTQPEPGWHQWHAPSGRTYTKDPKSYPA